MVKFKIIEVQPPEVKIALKKMFTYPKPKVTTIDLTPPKPKTTKTRINRRVIRRRTT